MEVGAKTNEIPKIKDLLDLLNVTDAIITVDALHTQVETARYLVDDKHAHYIMEVKRNQPSLLIEKKHPTNDPLQKERLKYRSSCTFHRVCERIRRSRLGISDTIASIVP